jgi:hypothetical protein
LKPAWEPIVLARKPLAGTIERNLAAHGTGALNTQACRVDGRFPANLVLSHSPDCAPQRCAPGCPATLINGAANGSRVSSRPAREPSRLFYCPKASRSERDAGCDELPTRALDLFPNAKHARRPPPRPTRTPPSSRSP